MPQPGDLDGPGDLPHRPEPLQPACNAVFGAQANAARAVIDADIAAWQNVIANFNYADGSNTFKLTLYMLPVNLLDNLLRPLVAKGLSTPMPVILIGVLGGTLVHGMIGLFVGPIVLSIAWQLLVVWTRDRPKSMDVVG